MFLPPLIGKEMPRGGRPGEQKKGKDKILLLRLEKREKNTLMALKK